MRTGNLLVDVAVTSLITFVVAAAVTCIYSRIAHDVGAVDWETAF